MAAKDRGAATVEIAFQAVTDRFVQQDARPAGAEHHRQHPRRGGDRREVNQRHAHRFFRPGIGPHFALLRGEEIVIAKTPAAAAAAALAFAVLFHQYADREAHQRTNVRGQSAVGGGHQNQFIDAAQAGRNLLHTLIRRASDFVDPAENIQLLFPAHTLQRVDAGIEGAVLYGAEGLYFAIAGLAHNGPRRLGALLQRQLADLVSVGKARFFAADGAHAYALVDIVRPIFNDAVFQNPGFVIARLKIEIAVIEAALGQLTKNGKQVLMIQAICRQ